TERSPTKSVRSQIATVRVSRTVCREIRIAGDLSAGSNLRFLRLLLGFRDHFLRDVRRNLLVAQEVHVVIAPPARQRGQSLRVGEDLGHRHLCLDRGHARARLHALQAPATGVEVAVDRPHRVVGDADLDLHDRLEQHRIGLLVRVLEGHRAGDLERHLRGVDLVLLAVYEPHLDSLYRRARKLAVLHRLLDALVDGRPETLRDHAADDLVHELVAGAFRKRLDHDLAVAELAATAGLLLVAVPGARLLADRLEIGDARLVQVDVHAEASTQPLDRDLDVYLAHPRKQLLAGLLV